MATQDETTISKYSENDHDELFLLTDLEYFSEKPNLKSKSFKEQLFNLCKTLSI